MVVGTDYRRRAPDEAVVDYDVDGRRRQTTLTVSSAGEFEVGSTIAIRYDPVNPEHARPLDGWSPTYQTMGIARRVAAF